MSTPRSVRDGSEQLHLQLHLHHSLSAALLTVAFFQRRRGGRSPSLQRVERMHFLTRVSREEPETDWEGGYFCQHVAVFVLFYFSCMLIVLASYTSCLQIFNGVRTIVKSSRRTQSEECDSSAPQGSPLLRPLAALKRRAGSMLGAVFRRYGDRKGHRRVHYPLEQMVPPSNMQLRHLKAGRHYKRQQSQYLHSSSGEILCYMPHKTLTYPYTNQTSTEIFKFRGFNRVDVWKTRYSKTGYRYVRSGGQASLRAAASIAAIENRLEVGPRLRSPFCSYGRAVSSRAMILKPHPGQQRNRSGIAEAEISRRL